MATASLTLQVQSQGVDSATNELQDLENQAGQTETAVNQLDTGSQQLSSSMQGLSGATSNLVNFLPSLGTAFALAASGLLALLTNAGSFRSELVRLADLSNTSVPEFQKISSAFKTLNVDMDKTADILKDVNDKVGDFVLTGGGEFKTIFEKVIKPLGKTREELTKIGPGGILLLVAEGLEKIGANGQETTFVLEALANDATLLVPLLENNGEALREISLAIEEKGLLLTETEVEALREANKQLSEIEVTVGNIFTKTKGFLAAAFFPKETTKSVEDLVNQLIRLDSSILQSEQKAGLLARNKTERLKVEREELKERIEILFFVTQE